MSTRKLTQYQVKLPSPTPHIQTKFRSRSFGEQTEETPTHGGASTLNTQVETAHQGHNFGQIPLLQPKLTVGAPHDHYEQEADRVADQVMSMPSPGSQPGIQRQAEEDELQTKPLASTITPLVQRAAAEDEELQTKPTIQRATEDEELQTKPIIQRVAEDEELQTKPAIQREAEDEELQTKPAIQRAAEDEELQTKPIIQRVAEDEELQTKPSLQRAEDEEELQTKPSIQRAAEDEELQTKPSIQREAEEEKLQTKPSIQRAAEDEELQTKPLQRKGGDRGFSASSNVESQLNSTKGSGSPLPTEVRAFMEPRFGVDLSHVRVHTGDAAVQMNREVGALAFTHRQDIYFGAGKSPGNDALTAHELTHVIQQTGGVSRKCAACQDEDTQIMRKLEGTPNVNGPLAAINELSGSQLRVQRQSNAPAQGANVDIPTGTPDRALTWSDFQGSPQGGAFAAQTSYIFVRKQVQGQVLFQAKFLPKRSWVLPKYKTPKNRQATGCAKPISDCERWLKKNPTGFYEFGGQPDPNCQDAIIAESVRVDSKDDCKSKIGSACDTAWERDSMKRLLPHEQLHFDIARTLAARANEKLKNGAKLNEVEKELRHEDKKLQDAYDTETKHGCKASYQASWNAGLY